MHELSLLMSSSSRPNKQWIDDVFSAYTYVGNGGTQTIVNGIDLAGKGGMVWGKNRTYAYQHEIACTQIGPNLRLASHLTTGSNLSDITAFNSNGFSVGFNTGNLNSSGSSVVSWTFRNASNFYHHAVVTKSSGSNTTYNFSTITTLGMVRVKRTDAVGSWYVWHRSLTAGKLLIGETTAAETTLGHITVSGSTVTLVNGVIADGTYLVEAFAHDESADGIIRCGSFTTDAGGIGAVNLGWEPQYVVLKVSNTTVNWVIEDISRGMANASCNDLWANLPGGEQSNVYSGVVPTATGFGITNNMVGGSRIGVYLAIRRPNKPPTSGTQVFMPVIGTNTVPNFVTGFPVDMHIGRLPNTSSAVYVCDRLRGSSPYITTVYTNAETTGGDGSFDSMIGSGSSYNAFLGLCFKRAPGVFDIVCYTGTGVAKTEVHGLGVAPELMIVKRRDGTTNWLTWHKSFAQDGTYILLNTTAIPAGSTPAMFGTVAPDSTSFRIGAELAAAYDPNIANATYVAYLFATKAGISKVFGYTGDGTSNATKIIDCGFTTGARFVLIKRTDSVGDWYFWDTARGIGEGNDPHMSLNTALGGVTDDDSIDPHVSGFSVNQVAATNINVSSATYIGLAYA